MYWEPDFCPLFWQALPGQEPHLPEQHHAEEPPGLTDIRDAPEPEGLEKERAVQLLLWPFISVCVPCV